MTRQTPDRIMDDLVLMRRRLDRMAEEATRAVTRIAELESQLAAAHQGIDDAQVLIFQLGTRLKQATCVECGRLLAHGEGWRGISVVPDDGRSGA